MPRAKWHVSFLDLNEKSKVETVVTYNSLKDLETIIEMGMEDGLKSTLERLDELLINVKKWKRIKSYSG